METLGEARGKYEDETEQVGCGMEKEKAGKDFDLEGLDLRRRSDGWEE